MQYIVRMRLSFVSSELALRTPQIVAACQWSLRDVLPVSESFWPFN